MIGNICLTVDTICKKLGIEYQSPHYKQFVFMKDAEKVVEVHRLIRRAINILEDIEVRHNIGKVSGVLLAVTQSLTTLDHDIINTANKLLKEEDEDKKPR